jgi:hypothetical protein
MRDEVRNDPILRPFVEALQAMPARDPALVARVLTATATPLPQPWWQRWRLPVMAVGTLAIGVMVALQATRTRERALPTLARVDSAPSAPAAPAVARAVTADGAMPATIPVQLTFTTPNAESVHLVGDFNDWNPTSAPLRRVGGQQWQIDIALTPGRHVYAFVIDGRQWVADPSAPRAPDDDFGQPGSVLLVRAP